MPEEATQGQSTNNITATKTAPAITPSAAVVATTDKQTAATSSAPLSDQQPASTLPSAPKTEIENESREEKVRRAKIAMEGLDRTIKRESVEKEEQASEEKQRLNKLLDGLAHEKELLELTWVNLDDKRTGLKKILEPIIAEEEKLESRENQEEGQESVTLNPSERQALEQKRWEIQSTRRKTEEEKWIVEEKIAKIIY